MAHKLRDRLSCRHRKRRRSRKAAPALGLGQRGDQFSQGAKVDTAPGLDRSEAERDGQVRLATAGFAKCVTS